MGHGNLPDGPGSCAHARRHPRFSALGYVVLLRFSFAAAFVVVSGCGSPEAPRDANRHPAFPMPFAVPQGDLRAEDLDNWQALADTPEGGDLLAAGGLTQAGEDDLVVAWRRRLFPPDPVDGFRRKESYLARYSLQTGAKVESHRMATFALDLTSLAGLPDGRIMCAYGGRTLSFFPKPAAGQDPTRMRTREVYLPKYPYNVLVHPLDQHRIVVSFDESLGNGGKRIWVGVFDPDTVRAPGDDPDNPTVAAGDLWRLDFGTDTAEWSVRAQSPRRHLDKLCLIVTRKPVPVTWDSTRRKVVFTEAVEWWVVEVDLLTRTWRKVAQVTPRAPEVTGTPVSLPMHVGEAYLDLDMATLSDYVLCAWRYPSDPETAARLCLQTVDLRSGARTPVQIVAETQPGHIGAFAVETSDSGGAFLFWMESGDGRLWDIKVAQVGPSGHLESDPRKMVTGIRVAGRLGAFGPAVVTRNGLYFATDCVHQNVDGLWVFGLRRGR